MLNRIFKHQTCIVLRKWISIHTGKILEKKNLEETHQTKERGCHAHTHTHFKLQSHKTSNGDMIDEAILLMRHFIG